MKFLLEDLYDRLSDSLYEDLWSLLPDLRDSGLELDVYKINEEHMAINKVKKELVLFVELNLSDGTDVPVESDIKFEVVDQID